MPAAPPTRVRAWEAQPSAARLAMGVTRAFCARERMGGQALKENRAAHSPRRAGACEPARARTFALRDHEAPRPIDIEHALRRGVTTGNGTLQVARALAHLRGQRFRGSSGQVVYCRTTRASHAPCAKVNVHHLHRVLEEEPLHDDRKRM